MSAPATHGVHRFLRSGTIAAENTYLTRVLREFQKAVEADILERRGELSIYDAAILQSAIRHEGIAQLWIRHVRKEAKSLTTEQRLAIGREIRNATDARDKCLRELGLNKRDSQLDDLYKAIDVNATEPGAADNA